jgi:hypothetical protein
MADVYIPSQYEGDSPVKKLLSILRSKKVLLVDRKELGSAMNRAFESTVLLGIKSRHLDPAKEATLINDANKAFASGDLSGLLDEKFDLGDYKTSPLIVAMRNAYNVQRYKEQGQMSQYSKIPPKDTRAVYQRAGFLVLRGIRDAMLSSGRSSDKLYEAKLKDFLAPLVDEYGKLGTDKTLMGPAFDSYSKHIEWILNNKDAASNQYRDYEATTYKDWSLRPGQSTKPARPAEQPPAAK